MQRQKSTVVAFCMWLLPLTFFAYQFILRLWPSLMMQQIMQRLAIDATAFGFLSSVYYWGYASMQIPIALALNRFKTRYVLFLCALICCIGTLLFSFTSDWHYALLSRFLVGAGSAAGFLATSKVISDWFDKNQYSNMVGFTFTFGMLGAIYAGKPVNMLIDAFGWQNIAFALGMVALILGILALVLLQTPATEQQQENIQLGDLTKILRSPVIWTVAIANLLMVGSLEGFADVWGVNYLMIAYNLNRGNAAQLISFIFVGMLFGGPLLAYLGKKLSNYMVITLCGCGMALVFMILMFTHNLSWFFLAASFFCIGVMCCYQVLVFTIGSELVNPSSIGITVAFLNCINMLGGSFFHSLIGLTMDIFWTGTMINNLRSYSLDSYQSALMIIPMCALIGASLIAIVGLKLAKRVLKNQPLLCLLILVRTSFFVCAQQEDKPSQYANALAKFGSHIAIGSVAGITEVLINQPLIYVKNTLQQRKKIIFHPSIWYRGFGVNIACMVPTTAVQISTNKVLEDVFCDASVKAAMLRSLSAGALSALVSNPIELVILHQQNDGKAAYPTIKNLTARQGLSGLYRGLSPKMLRDGLFGVGFLSMYPLLESKIRATFIDDKSLAFIMAGVATGAMTAVVSHPFDTISTFMQADYNKEQVATTAQTIRTIYARDGYSGFFKGVSPRGARIMLAIPLMNAVQSYMSK
jgi:predicted MFS family arabinose efflux permease